MSLADKTYQFENFWVHKISFSVSWTEDPTRYLFQFKEVDILTVWVRGMALGSPIREVETSTYFSEPHPWRMRIGRLEKCRELSHSHVLGHRAGLTNAEAVIDRETKEPDRDSYMGEFGDSDVNN